MIPSTRLWESAPPTLSLASDEVHVWRARLDDQAPCLTRLSRTLSHDEQAKASCFHRPRDRCRFIIGRGLLRAILARYLDVEPSQLQFCYGVHGKPYLIPPAHGGWIRFNLSHSQGLALYATGRRREVGIDLEYVQPDFPAEQIAVQFLAPQEVATLRTLPTERHVETFFACWSRKEAYLKALGGGLTLPLDEFAVSCAPGQPPVLLDTTGDANEPTLWSLKDLAPAPGYVAAVAAEGHDWHLSLWEWTTAPGPGQVHRTGQ